MSSTLDKIFDKIMDKYYEADGESSAAYKDAISIIEDAKNEDGVEPVYIAPIWICPVCENPVGVGVIKEECSNYCSKCGEKIKK